MILIIGGAYQGKLDFAKEQFALSDSDIFNCTGGEIDFTRRCVNSLEEFTRYCVRMGCDPVEWFKANRDSWRDSILICEDITCGVVPLGLEMRRWRDETGKLCQYLASEATQVSRIFCGLEQRLK